jgi:hypothetical protein
VIFVSYSHRDETWRERFEIQSKPLGRAESMRFWSDRNTPGHKPPSSGMMVARLLGPINTKSAPVVDQFTAVVEEGPHKGAILSGAVNPRS